MPTVEFDTQEILKLLGKDYRMDYLRDRIPMIGVSLESFDNKKTIIEAFPNRPDLLSIEGFVRALRGFLSIEVGFKKYDLKDSRIKLYIDSSVKNVRPYIASGIVKNVALDNQGLKSLMDLQEKLHLTHGKNREKVAIGVHDLDKVEAPFLYKAVKPDEISFIPLDMNEPLNLRQILQRHPKGRDYAGILKNFDRYPIILDKNNNVLSFPPIINGELTRVTENTKNLFIELTGTSNLAVNQALNIVIASISDRGGEIYSVELIGKGR